MPAAQLLGVEAAGLPGELLSHAIHSELEHLRIVAAQTLGLRKVFPVHGVS
jgi:hypothetical protein